MKTDWKDKAKLQFIMHANGRFGYYDGVEVAIKGGCRWIQMRAKAQNQRLNDVQRLELAQRVKSLCDRHDAVFIIDDDVELVKKIHADGVHLGMNDMPIAEARKILGDGFIIGGTANNIDDIIYHCNQGADYIGCGPFRFTTTKEKIARTLGVDGYKDIVCELRNRNMNVSLVAIGGICLEDVDELMKTGIAGIAVSGCVLNAENPIKYVENLKNIIR
ncbi:MAG: thiamine phosphate synthase [Bacteroidales bacterium]|nr:thiamine phosphate synthase [Bacteroidales bacterium]